MSNNHPNDNIYSILGKLNALKPTQEEKHQSLLKEIRESVEAKGSITEGVSSVESKLRQQFNEGEVTRLPGKTIHRSTHAYGGGSDTQGVEFAKQKHHADLNKVNKPLTKSLEKGMDVDMDEKAPPGAKAERMVKGIKKSLSKDGHLSDKDKAIAYATTWKAHNKGQVEEAYNPVKAVKQCAKSIMGMNGIASVHDLDAEDIEYIGDECQMNYHDVCEILGCNLPDSLGPVKSWDTDEQGNKFDLEEGLCAECGMNEGECEHTVAEAEITRTAGKTVHRKTDFPGYPADDTDDLDNLRGPGAGKRGRPRKHAVVAPKVSATGEKLGRGRPMKDKAPTFSKQADPFGRISGTVPKGSKGKVHSMAESMEQLELALSNMLSESRLMDDAGETLQHILNRFRAEVRGFEQGGDLDRELYEALYDYYVECGEMPYGVQKARTEDPMQWVAQNLESHLRGGSIVGGNPDEDYGLEREGIEGNMPPVDNIPGKEDLLKGKGRDYYEEVDPMENELNELARLAGLNTEGNAFGAAVARAKDDGIQSGEKVEVGGEEYPVKEAEAPVDEPDEDEYQNEPHEKYGTIKQITSQGDDLNRRKKQDPHTANKAANPLTNSPTLEAKLAAEYESIKKVN